MYTFIILFLIVFSTVGLSAYIYNSQNYLRWVLYFISSLILLGIFVYARNIDVLAYKDSELLSLIKFRKESFSVSSYWCTVCLTFISLFSLPFSLDEIKKNKFAFFSVLVVIILIFVTWRI